MLGTSPSDSCMRCCSRTEPATKVTDRCILVLSKRIGRQIIDRVMSGRAEVGLHRGLCQATACRHHHQACLLTWSPLSLDPDAGKGLLCGGIGRFDYVVSRPDGLGERGGGGPFRSVVPLRTEPDLVSDDGRL